MKDIVKKVDALKAAIKVGFPEPSEAEAHAMAFIAIDFVAELVANSRRIAQALETIAARKPDV